MATFTLNWDNSLVLAEPNAINQRASYRIKTVGGAFITTGFTPTNDMSTAVISATHNGTENKIYEFKVEALCTAGGPTMNDNGIVEQIVFECVDPSSLTADDDSITISLNLTATDITKVRFKLRKQGDDSLVQTITTVCPGGIGSTSANFTALSPNTAYYITAEFYCTINGVEVISSSSDYLNAVCGGNIVGWKITTDALATPNIVFSWNRINGEAINLTSNINGSFTSIDWGDGTVNASLSHTYTSTANFTVKIYSSTATNITLANGIDAITYNITAFTAIPATVTHLDLHHNLITTPVVLTSNTSLIYLDYSENSLTSFPTLTNNLLLQELYLNNNSIAGSYNFTLNTALTILNLSTNSITSTTGFSSTTGLYNLQIDHNSIPVTDINNALIALDTNGITNGNFISTIQAPLAAPTGLGITAKNNLVGKGWTVLTD